jgi:hypothetical protein
VRDRRTEVYAMATVQKASRTYMSHLSTVLCHEPAWNSRKL